MEISILGKKEGAVLDLTGAAVIHRLHIIKEKLTATLEQDKTILDFTKTTSFDFSFFQLLIAYINNYVHSNKKQLHIHTLEEQKFLEKWETCGFCKEHIESYVHITE